MGTGDGEVHVLSQLLAYREALTQVRLSVAKLETATAYQAEGLAANIAKQSSYAHYINSLLAVHNDRLRRMEDRSATTDREIQQLRAQQGKLLRAIERLEELPQHLRRQADILKYALAAFFVGGALASQNGLASVNPLLKLIGVSF